MSNFTKELVDKYAEDLLIGLTSEENKMVLDEMDVIDSFINKINLIPNIEDVTPMTHCLDDFVVTLRSDEVTESINIEDLLSNCDLVDAREIEVPKVVGNE
ncbi:MAG: Asp-tRNA(Asn)/Glu-tRNA(Gln) amidotransferase subunit GatC [Bacilli bacterium]